MKTIERWFVRCVLAVGLLFAGSIACVFVVMSRPYVRQSNGYTAITPEALTAPLSQSFPKTATSVRYGRSSVGIGGRLLMYRFSAPAADLHLHAAAEFAAHWDTPTPQKIVNTPAPITKENIAAYQATFGIDASWMLPPPGTVGTLYISAEGQSPHRPTIFIDEANGVLYFQMTD